MALNIKNARTEALARELAELTDENLTDAVTAALQERLERLRRECDVDAKVERMLAIGREIRARMSPEDLALDHAELLYDEVTGLPK